MVDSAFALQKKAIKIVYRTFWPSFKFRGINHVKSFFLLNFLFKKTGFESLYFRLFKIFVTSIDSKLVLDINLIKCYEPSANIVIDMPTNYFLVQDFEWQVEEQKTGIKISRRENTSSRISQSYLDKHFELCNSIVVPSTRSKESLPERFQAKALVIPFAEKSLLKNKSIHHKKFNKILCIGLVCPSKGYHYMVEGFNILDEDFEIHFYGKINVKYKDYLINLADDQIKLNFHGNVKQEYLFKIIPLHDLLVFPSVSEGLPLSAIQALNRKLPVFASKNSNLIDVLPEFCIYDTRDPLDFAKRFIAFKNKTNYNLKTDNFTENHIITQWKKILES